MFPAAWRFGLHPWDGHPLPMPPPSFAPPGGGTALLTLEGIIHRKMGGSMVEVRVCDGLGTDVLPGEHGPCCRGRTPTASTSGFGARAFGMPPTPVPLESYAGALGTLHITPRAQAACCTADPEIKQLQP